MNRTRAALAILLTMILGFGLAACGSDSDSDSAGDSGTTTEASTGSTDSSGADAGNTGSVEGTKWELMNIASTQGFATSLPNTIEPPTLEFDGDTVQVYTSCNSGSGSVEVGEDTIVFGPIALTKRGCEKLASQTESFVMGVLDGEVKYEFNQGNLVLTKKDLSLIFTAG